MLPHHCEVLAQREQPVALLIAARDPPAGPRGALGFHLRDMRAGVMPAPFEFSCHQTVVRIDPIILPSGPRGLVTRLFQGSFSCLPWRIMGRLDLIDAMQAACTPAGWRASRTAAFTA